MVLVKEKMREKIGEGVIPSNLRQSPSWKRGYAAFNALLGNPLGWLYVPAEGKENLVRLDPKRHCPWYAQSRSHQETCERYLVDFARTRKQEADVHYRGFRCHAGLVCAVFPLKFFTDQQGCFLACNLRKPILKDRTLADAFHEFLKSEMSLAQKNYELRHFYETVHPRALALSTMHSVHRVISTAFNLDELMPRIARLTVQILKVKHCSIYLLDEDRRFLTLKFSTDSSHVPRLVRRKVGQGLEGRVAQGGEIYFSGGVLAVPFIEKDVVGVMTVRDRLDKKPFSPTDLEILKLLSEQTVVAIKNAELYDETQQLTIGIIQSIAELLELGFAGDNVHLPLFKRLVREMGIDLGLSRRELVDLERAVVLLDTGYIGIPGEILSKKTALTEEEYETVKKHPHRGAQILKSIHSLKPVIPIILHHHERYDGKGYPQALKGEEIPIGARIVAVADSFTAMISRRPYREIKRLSDAAEEIKRHSGTQFDPRVVESFLKVIQEKKLIKMEES